MRKETNIDKKMVARAIIQKLQDEKRPRQIKTNYLPGFDSPDKIALKTNTEEKDLQSPDITATYDGETHLYEIELDDKLELDKWRLFSLYAKKQHGNFYLVVPDWLRESVKEELKKSDINAGLIYFNTSS